MSKIRLIISDASLTNEGILIKKMEVIDTISGDHLRIAKLNTDILEFIKMIEIELDDFLEAKEMKAKNPNFMKLCSNFKLYT